MKIHHKASKVKTNMITTIINIIRDIAYIFKAILKNGEQKEKLKLLKELDELKVYIKKAIDSNDEAKLAELLKKRKDLEERIAVLTKNRNIDYLKKIAPVIFAFMLFSGCAHSPNTNNFQVADLTVILIPKEVEQREITVNYVKHSDTGESTIVTRKHTVPNLFYPYDSTYLCSGTKAKNDLGAQLDNLSTQVK